MVSKLASQLVDVLRPLLDGLARGLFGRIPLAAERDQPRTESVQVAFVPAGGLRDVRGLSHRLCCADAIHHGRLRRSRGAVVGVHRASNDAAGGSLFLGQTLDGLRSSLTHVLPDAPLVSREHVILRRFDSDESSGLATCRPVLPVINLRGSCRRVPKRSYWFRQRQPRRRSAR